VRGTTWKLFVAMLLALCVGVYALEVSGRWDRSIQDANDEAGLVAIVLCVGVALTAAGSCLQYLRVSRTTVRIMAAAFTASHDHNHRPAVRLVSTSGPPGSLRI